MTQRNKFYQMNYLQENVLKWKLLLVQEKKWGDPQRYRLWAVGREGLGITK